MFCGNCGKENPDGATYCVECGNKLSVGNASKNNLNRNRKIGIAAVAALGLVIVLVIAFFPSSRSYKDIINTFFDAQFDGDMETIIELVPEEIFLTLAEKSDMSEDELDEEIEKLIDEGNENLVEGYEYIDEITDGDWDLDYKIVRAKDLSNDDYEEVYDFYNDEVDLRISDAKEIEVEINVRALDKEESTTMSFFVIKVGRSWYLDIKMMAGTIGDIVNFNIFS